MFYTLNSLLFYNYVKKNLKIITIPNIRSHHSRRSY